MKHCLNIFSLCKVLLLLAFAYSAQAQHVGSPIGFATVPDYGVSQISGGAGGEVVIINGQADAKKMQDALDNDDTPKIIYLYGTVTFPAYPDGVGPVSDESDRMTMVRSNKTILGMGPDATIKDCGLSIYSGSGEGPDAQLNGVRNVIIQNVNFTGALDDALNIQGGSHHIWVDHCTFTDGYDGLLDVKRGSDYVTVSHNVFSNHGKMSLVGHSGSSDIVAIDEGHLRVTYHHNWFTDEGSSIRSSRHPRVRTGDVHVFNNYYLGREDATMDYAVASNVGADVVVENNYMLNVKRPAERGYAGESEGDLVFDNNIVINNLYPPMVGGSAFNPSSVYSYSMMPAADVPAYVMANAGTGKINVPAPGETDNTTYYSLSTNVNGQGSVSPDGGSYAAGSTVYLTANPASGWEFSGWSGAVSGTSNPLSLTMNGHKQATATFTEVDNGGGDPGDGSTGGSLVLGNNLSITGPGPGADGSGKASGTSYGNLIDGSTSSVWGATGTSNENIAVKWSSPVTANTVIIREVGNNITSWRLETAGGSTIATGSSAGAEKLIQFESATESKFRFVILSASANPQISEFEVYNASGSPGDDGGTITYQLSTSVNGQGSVSPSGATYNEGEVVSLTATAASGWEFSGWSGDASGTGNPLSLTMNGNKSVTANFTETPSNDCSIVTLQAEDGAYSSGSVDSNHSGFTGSGFVNTDNATGEWLDISVNAASAGNAVITLRYADGKTDERSVSVSVNGSEVIPYLDMPATDAWSNWAEVAFSVNLDGGNNTIRLTALNSGGLPNIDKADACVMGGGSTDPEPVNFQLSTSVNGEGTVNPGSGTYEEGSSVSLTATPASGWEFSGWSGSASGSTNPLSLYMDGNKSVTATFTQSSTPPPPPVEQTDGPLGFASMAGGTTGGAGGTSVTVSTGTELQAAINNKGNQPLIIYVNGTITPSNSSGLSKIDVKEVSDISILGLGSGAEFNGIGIKVYKASNIIIRNLKIHHVNIGDKDCISIEGPADHVWVDHCELYNEYQGTGKDYYDGLLDAKRDAYYITFSYNYLHDSWKAALSGSGDGDNYDRQITYHHNIFENINSRLPLFRFGTGHVFNNYYIGVESTAINSRMGACIKIENNYFENVLNPWVSAYSSEDGYGDISGNQLVNSTFEYSSDTRELQFCTANIPYAYAHALISASQVPAYVRANAGVGKINVTTQTTANARTKDGSLPDLSASANEPFSFYPNPFEGASTFEVTLSEEGKVRISLHNLQGNRIAIIADQLMNAGMNKIRYENSSIQPGMYFYLIETEEGSFRRKVLVK